MKDEALAVREDGEVYLSASIAKVLLSDSPLHAWTAHPRLNPDYQSEDKTAFDLGKVTHALLLQGEWNAEVLDFDDYRKDKAKEARELARLNGKIPILRKHEPAVRAMVEAANIQLAGRNVFEAPGSPEVRIIWAENGVKWKSRLDWLPDSLKYIDDYKTTAGTANPEVISRTLFSNGWDVQAVTYIHAVKSLNPDADPTFRFIVQENAPPYALSIIGLSPDVLMLAEKKFLYACEVWKECLETNVWPGYPRDVCFATLPPWEESRWLEKELR